MAYSRMTPHLLKDKRSIMTDIPQATVLEARNAIFLPIQKVTARTLAAFKKNHPKGRVISTDDESLNISIDSPLTQTHKNFLEVLTSSLVPYYSVAGGPPTFVFTRYWGADELGMGDHYEQLDAMIKYLQKALITVTVGAAGGTHSESEGIITRAGKITNPEAMATELGIPVKGTHELRYVRLSEHYMRAFAADDTLRYPTLVRKIVELSHPVLQALVRYAMSHRTLNHALLDTKLDDGAIKDGLLTKIGVARGSAQYDAQALILERAAELISWDIEIKPDARKRVCAFMAARIKDAYYCGRVAQIDQAEIDLRWDGKPIPAHADHTALRAYITGARKAKSAEVLAAGGTKDDAYQAANAYQHAIEAYARNKAGVREEDDI